MSLYIIIVRTGNYIARFMNKMIWNLKKNNNKKKKNSKNAAQYTKCWW